MTFNPDNPNEHAQADAFDAATNAQLTPLAVYGQVGIDAWFCALVKGKGKVPFDPTQHDRRATALDVTITPLIDQGLSFDLTRSMIAESVEWTSIVWPSAKELGVTNARELEDKWVKATQQATGRKYRNKSGEEKEASTIKFLALYADEEACREAFYAETGKPRPDADGVSDIPGFETETNEDKERESAHTFLAAMAKQYGGDMTKIEAWVRTMPSVSKYYADTEAIQAVVNDVFRSA